jgi:hypothetical protein
MSRHGSHFAHLLHQQQKWRGDGKQETEPQPEQPERSSSDVLWLEENNLPKPRPSGAR